MFPERLENQNVLKYLKTFTDNFKNFYIGLDMNKTIACSLNFRHKKKILHFQYSFWLPER